MGYLLRVFIEFSRPGVLYFREAIRMTQMDWDEKTFLCAMGVLRL